VFLLIIFINVTLHFNRTRRLAFEKMVVNNNDNNDDDDDDDDVMWIKHTADMNI